MNIKFLFIFLFMMISVGFYMLIERKILGYFNNRLGPNKIGILGLIQFLVDLIKLMFKENLMLMVYSKISYYLFIMILFLLSFFMWFFIPFTLNLFNFKLFSLLLIMVMINKILVFINLIWFINSIFSLLSIMRLLMQNFSYEILFMLIFFFFFFFLFNFNLILILKIFNFSYLIMYSFLIFYFWFITMLIELNRVPFDYFESESELISGFNIEFNSLNFMLLFLIEYLDMIFMSLLTLFIFFSFNIMSFFFYIFMYLILILVLFFRGFLIRYRIDKMFNLLWKLIFPLMFNYFIFFLLLLYL